MLQLEGGQTRARKQSRRSCMVDPATLKVAVSRKYLLSLAKEGSRSAGGGESRSYERRVGAEARRHGCEQAYRHAGVCANV